MMSSGAVSLGSRPWAKLRSVDVWGRGGIDCDPWRQSQCALSVLRYTHDDQSGVDSCTIRMECLGGGVLGGVVAAVVDDDDVGGATPL